MTDQKRTSSNEEEYFARREAELLRQQRETAQQAAVDAERKSHYMKCPKCGYDLITADMHGIAVDQCTHCHGIWFDAGEVDALMKHQDTGMFGRVVGSIMRGVGGARANPK